MAKSVLFICNVPPISTVGGGIRSILLAKLFEKKGFNVKFYIIYPFEWGELAESWVNEINLEYELIGVHYYKIKDMYTYEHKLIKELYHIQKKVDMILYRFEAIAFKCYFFLSTKPVVIDYDDFAIPTLKTGKSMLVAKSKLYFARLFVRNAIVLEQDHLRYFSNKAVLIPNLSMNVIKNMVIKKSRSEYPSMIFVGSDPQWLVEFIKSDWESIYSVYGNAKIFVVSQSPLVSALSEYEDKGIVILSNVDNLIPYYQLAWLAVFPSFHKYGTHIKILEAIFYKTPVVTTKFALRGYHFFNRDGDVIYAGENYSQMSEAILFLLAHPHLIEAISEKGFKIASSSFGLDCFDLNWIK